MGVRKEHQRHSRHVTRTKRWKVLRVDIIVRDGGKCRHCGKRGRLEVDHIKPVRTHPELAFDPENLQTLCPACHTRKTRVECGHKPTPQTQRDWRLAVKNLEAKETNFSIPFRLRRSAVPVTLVYGPPGAGKSTFALKNAKPEDTLIDLDLFLHQVGGRPWEPDQSLVRRAFALHDKALHSLSVANGGRAWLVKTAASKSERMAWKLALGPLTETPILTPPDTCLERIKADPARVHRASQMCAAVHDWWRTYTAENGEISQTKGELRCLTP